MPQSWALAQLTLSLPRRLNYENLDLFKTSVTADADKDRKTTLKPKLILHIGAHRTATTSLQAHLYKNVKTLKDKGVLYPFNVRRHLRLMHAVFSGKRTVADTANNILKRIESQSQDIHTVILSDEDVCIRPDLSILTEFQDKFDVKIAFTLRRQDTWLESWFFQNIKWQWNPNLAHCTFEQFLPQRDRFHWVHYDRYVSHLEKLFGKENILLNVHERGQMPDGPIAAFFDRIGLTDYSDLADAPHINNRFSPQVSEFMRNLPLDEAPVPYRDILAKACARMDRTLNENKPRQSELMLTHEQRVSVLSEYEEGNKAIAQRYFGRDQLFFDALPPADAPLADMSLPATNYELMEHMVAPLIRELIANYNEENKKS
jgi:hypothetical protein